MYSLKDYLSEALIKHKISNYDNDDDAIDFGLSVKWLKYNLAGNKLTDDESDYGYYYQWGSTIGYPDASTHTFSSSWTDTPYCNVSHNSFTKYVIKPYFGTVDNKKVLDPEDDAVTVLLGSEYRMPTKDEYNELYKHCGGKHSRSLSGTTSISKTGIYWVKAGTTVNGIKYTNAGRLFVGQDVTKRVFFPAAGNCCDSSVCLVGSGGCYWSSSLYSSTSIDAYLLYFSGSSVSPAYSYSRYGGFSVRGVKVN